MSEPAEIDGATFRKVLGNYPPGSPSLPPTTTMGRAA